MPSLKNVAIPCYLVEWYRPDITGEPLEQTAARLRNAAATMSPQASPIQLLTMLAVPDDEVIFGVFTAGSATDVAQTCDCAGIPAQRLTAASDFLVPRAL